MVENLLEDRARQMRRQVMRFWNNDVLTDSVGVQHAIAARLGLKWLP